jgi:hypothetical protein
MSVISYFIILSDSKRVLYGDVRSNSGWSVSSHSRETAQKRNLGALKIPLFIASLADAFALRILLTCSTFFVLVRA